MTAEQILDSALNLPDDQRAMIAERLFQSLDQETFTEDVADAWRGEIQRRLEQVQSGSVKGRPWEEVRAELDRKLNELRNP